MPHKRKGKVRVYPSEPSLPSDQRLIREYATSVAQAAAPAGGGVRGEPISPGEISLSLPNPKHAQQASSPESPEATGEPRGNSVGGDQSVGAEGVSSGVATTSTPIKLNGAVGEGGRMAEVAERVDSTSRANGVSQNAYRIEKPAIVTLDSLWELMAGMDIKIQEQSHKLQGVSAKLDIVAHDHQQILQEQGSAIQRIESEVKDLKEVSAAFSRERLATLRKMEFLENSLRHLNLRLLNFPVIKDEQCLVTIKKYLGEFLKIPQEKIPVIKKILHLSQRQSTPRISVLDNMDNLTQYLEASEIEVARRETLLVTFISEEDINLIMRNYYKNLRVPFCGDLVRIFPDLAKATQVRRKAFLQMKPNVLSLGASFIVKYPCKCVIGWRGSTYIFFDIPQLREFLSSKCPMTVETSMEG
ncbi:uncharacterized protein LOC115086980 [Rhinatrema bivittatum]|uniref:uncharacterized protein LOC115086980 n=1 Tax=Rhinatrema bivittatum TaxID=194408 RepID=UPI00112D2301|nr:uncharacterized protein LOC115086980 [Rhinatrema bivittatum]XP_029449410.1 uncharacterized protein LOC115086980 [Rhinatrema bivittatum]